MILALNMTTKARFMKTARTLLIQRTGVAVALLALITSAHIVTPAQAHGQGADDFLRDINGIGIGNANDPHNFDLVGFGNALCWRLYSGQAPARIVENVIADSPSPSRPGLTPQQAQAVVDFARTDLCPDAATRSEAPNP